MERYRKSGCKSWGIRFGVACGTFASHDRPGRYLPRPGPGSMMFLSMLAGATLGLSVAMPFGPVGLLCIQRSIAAGAILGIATGLGAAVVHVLYATLAILGASTISAELINWSHLIRYISCLLLIVLGIRVLRRAPPATTVPRVIKAPNAFASSFAVAICNPLTIIPYLLFASNAPAVGMGSASLTAWSAVGVFIGTAGWYCMISGAAAAFRSSLPPAAARGLNGVAGAILIGFGFLVLCR